MERVEATPKADLVCEGGGIRGIGLTGAVHTLAAAGYQFPRVAGSSAGAVVASMIAALQVAVSRCRGLTTSRPASTTPSSPIRL